MKILAVVTNYQRPANVRLIVDRLYRQDCDIAIVDNSPHRLMNDLVESGTVKDVFQWRTNSGPPCRFAPAMMMTGYDYVLFVDDDLMPTVTCIDVCKRLIDLTEGRFACIGQIGRAYIHGTGYQRRNVKGSGYLLPVDTTCRMHLVEFSRVWAWSKMRSRLMHRYGFEGDHLWHDDLMLNHGVQHEYDLPSYILPSCSPESKLIERNLDDGVNAGVDSMSSKPNHVEIRQKIINTLGEFGWESQIENAESFSYS